MGITSSQGDEMTEASIHMEEPASQSCIISMLSDHASGSMLGENEEEEKGDNRARKSETKDEKTTKENKENLELKKEWKQSLYQDTVGSDGRRRSQPGAGGPEKW